MNAEQREGRFSFVFTPKHGSWLNLVEGFFSRMARSALRHIRVASKDELRQRIIAYLDDLNRKPDKHTYKDRHLGENFFDKIKQFRAIPTRYDKIARNFLAAVHLVASVVWLN